MAIAPGAIMILLIIIPSMLTALGVVREKEIGSISNLKASPATVGEFLLGSRRPMSPSVSPGFLSLALLVDVLFGVTVKGCFAALLRGGFSTC